MHSHNGDIPPVKPYMVSILVQLATCADCADPCLAWRWPHCVIGVALAFVASCPCVMAVSICRSH